MHAYMESLAMERQSVAHNRDQLGMDLILMFMVVLRGGDKCPCTRIVSSQHRDRTGQGKGREGEDLHCIIIIVVMVGERKRRRGKSNDVMIVASRTRLSLSNSISITACFGLRWRRKVSRTYGMSAIIAESDCDASATGTRAEIE